MKKILLVSSIAMLFVAACQQTPEPATVDLQAEENAAMEMLDGFLNVMYVQDVDSMATYIAEDALICGSDPTEMIDKEEAIEAWREVSSGQEIDFLLLDEQAFKMAQDGNSAIAVKQFYIPMMLPEIPVRHTFYLTKVEGDWKITFWGASLIPKNEDLPTIVGAMMPEE